MKAVKFDQSNVIINIPEDGRSPEERPYDLHACQTHFPPEPGETEGQKVMIMQWQLTDEDRIRVSLGMPVYFMTWGWTVPVHNIQLESPFQTQADQLLEMEDTITKLKEEILRLDTRRKLELDPERSPLNLPIAMTTEELVKWQALYNIVKQKEAKNG